MHRELLIEKFIPPTEIIYYDETTIYGKVWRNKYGEVHSFNNQPAYISYHTNGEVSCVHYGIFDKFYRNKGKPALIEYNENGKTTREGWYKNGVFTKVKRY